VLYAIEGIATALFNPASNALVPIVVTGPQLQNANALLSLSKSVGKVAGPVLAGILLAFSSPGTAIAVDAGTFGISAAFLMRIVARRVRPESATSFVEDLREGWVEFSSRSWLWACVLAAAFSNAIFFPAFQVLGPTVADESLGGPGAWALIAAAFGVGAVVGGGFGLAVRTRRILLVAEAVVLLVLLPLVLLAVGANAFAIAGGAFVAGVALSLSEILYETAIQQHVPPAAMARVSAYDWFGSLAIQPIGFALVGSIAAGIGISTLLWLEAGLLVLTQGAVLMVPSVRKLQSLPPREEADWPAELSPVAPGD
jgi:MFS family permease